MNTMELNSKIELYRPLEALSSLPIAYSDSDGEVKAIWFNYYLDQNDDEIIISIDSIFIVDGNMKIKESKVDLLIKSKLDAFDEPELERHEFLELLESQFINYNYEKMYELLKQAEMQPLLVAYKTVMEFIAQEEK